jgi:hypothetical protein
MYWLVPWKREKNLVGSKSLKSNTQVPCFSFLDMNEKILFYLGKGNSKNAKGELIFKKYVEGTVFCEV